MGIEYEQLDKISARQVLEEVEKLRDEWAKLAYEFEELSGNKYNPSSEGVLANHHLILSRLLRERVSDLVFVKKWLNKNPEDK